MELAMKSTNYKKSFYLGLSFSLLFARVAIAGGPEPLMDAPQKVVFSFSSAKGFNTRHFVTGSRYSTPIGMTVISPREDLVSGSFAGRVFRADPSDFWGARAKAFIRVKWG